ncbi:MAG: class I SAM-dependent methyltransferase [Planctomycetota bacterium]|jgi:SAM-dependent methyltransferase
MIIDEYDPLDPIVAEAQMVGLTSLLPAGAHVLDLGCGDGRVAVPLAEQGHRLTALDNDPEALVACAGRARDRGVDLTLVEADATGAWDVEGPEGGWDAILCLGNTFMTFTDPALALAIVEQAARRLRPGGAFCIDDIPGLHWPEVAEGNWATGLSPDDQLQMVWAEDDAVFTLRQGDAVDPDVWQLVEGDRLFRLWSGDGLWLLARAAGLSAPARGVGGGLLVMHRPDDEASG